MLWGGGVTMRGNYAKAGVGAPAQALVHGKNQTPSVNGHFNKLLTEIRTWLKSFLFRHSRRYRGAVIRHGLNGTLIIRKARTR